jgi:hypothetical protein
MSARPILFAVSQNASSDTGHPCRERVGTGVEVAAGEALEELGDGVEGGAGGASADPQEISPTSTKDTTDHVIPYEICSRPRRRASAVIRDAVTDSADLPQASSRLRRARSNTSRSSASLGPSASRT